MTPRVPRLAICSFVALAGAAVVTPQLINPIQHLDFDRPESWGMKYFASATLMNGLGAPRRLRFGEMRVALQGAWIPFVSDSQRVIGFNGTKAEDLNKLPVFGRIEFTFGLPWWLSLTIGWVPPIIIRGVQANLFSLALARPFRLTRNFTLGLSIYGQTGPVTGAFTCSEDDVRAGQNPEKNPLGCLQQSHDEEWMSYFGGEVTLAYRIVHAHGLEPYLGVAGNFLDLSFHVDARYDATIDQTILETHGGTVSTDFGLLLPITRRLDLVGEGFYSPLSIKRANQPTHLEGLLNVRFLVGYRFF
jgi:hypothetical protein